MKTNRAVLSLLAIYALSGLVNAASPEEEPQSATESSSGSKGRVLEEIVVTATKRARSVRTLPITIDAFTGDELVDKGLVSLESIIELSPGVTFANRAEADSQTINIRGVGSSFAARFFNRPYGLFYENVSLINPTTFGVQPAMEPFDMATVEVLKGPQGTLFGGTGLIGGVRYDTNRPEFDRYLAKVSGAHSRIASSDDKSKEYSAVLNFPIIEDVLAARYTITDRKEAGYIDDLNNERDDVNAFNTETWRAQLAWNVTSNFSARGSVVERTVDQVDAATPSTPERYETDNKFFVEPSNSLVEIGILNLNWAKGENFDISLDASQLDKTMRQNRDVSGNVDTEDSGVRGVIPIFAESDQFTVEARLTGSTNADCNFWLFCSTEYLVGIVKSEAQQYVSIGSSALYSTGVGDAGENLIVSIDALADEKAIFFDITRYFYDGEIVVNLGGRYFKQRTVAANHNSIRVAIPVAETTPLGPLFTTESFPSEYIDQKVEEFNPKIAVTWNVKDNLALFTSAVRGFRFGGINIDIFQSDFIPVEFEPDSVWNYELGVRSEWFDQRLQLDVTAYYVEWENAQQGLYDTSRVGVSAYIKNFGSSTVRGAEFNVRASLPYGFTYSLSGAYNDAVNNEFFQARQARAEAGDVNPGSPYWTGSTNINWKGYFGGFDFGANLGFTYQSVSKNSWEIPIEIDPIDNVSASLRVANESWYGKPALSLTAVNLENDINLSAFTSDRGANSEIEDNFYYLTSPRKITLRLELTFD